MNDTFGIIVTRRNFVRQDKIFENLACTIMKDKLYIVGGCSDFKGILLYCHYESLAV